LQKSHPLPPVVFFLASEGRNGDGAAQSGLPGLGDPPPEVGGREKRAGEHLPLTCNDGGGAEARRDGEVRGPDSGEGMRGGGPEMVT